MTGLLDVRGQSQLIFDCAGLNSKAQYLVKSSPAHSKFVHNVRPNDVIIRACQAPVVLRNLDCASECRAVETGWRGTSARKLLILSYLVSKTSKGRLFRSYILVDADIALVTLNRGRKIRHVIVDDRIGVAGVRQWEQIFENALGNGADRALRHEFVREGSPV